MPRILLPVALVTCALVHAADLPVVGFLRVDAAKYYAEEQTTHPYGTRVLAPAGLRFGLA